MSLKSIGKNVAKIAPLLGTALGGPAGTAIGSLVASALGVEDSSDAIEKAIATDPQAASKLRDLEMQHERELRALTLEVETRRLAIVNATIRSEYQSDDRFVKRWRPTFGYAVAATWCVQTIGIVAAVLYAVIGEPGEAAMIIEAVGAMIGALGLQWGVALSVLGVSVHKRSQDKVLTAGHPPPEGILTGLAKRLTQPNDQKPA